MPCLDTYMYIQSCPPSPSTLRPWPLLSPLDPFQLYGDLSKQFQVPPSSPPRLHTSYNPSTYLLPKQAELHCIDLSLARSSTTTSRATIRAQ